MNRRIACVALPNIRVELARMDGTSPASPGRGRDLGESSADLPLAVMVARPGGAVKTERDVLGNTKIDFVSREARRLGVRPGQTVAAARAKCAGLRVRVVAESTVRTSLERIAEVMLAFGPTTAFDVAQDVVWVDVSGCAHLHGGEVELARSIGASARALGHVCRVSLAGGPRISAAVARFSPSPQEEPRIVPEEDGAVAVRELPIAALELDEDVVTWLADLGLSKCGDLQRLPRRALGLRLGNRVHDVMQFLDGRDFAPLDAWRPPEIPQERAELEWGIQSIEAIAFILKILCDRLSARLQGRALAAIRLEVEFSLDRALATSDDLAKGRSTWSIALSSPIARASDLLAVVRSRLEGCSLPAPALAVSLRASELASLPARTVDLLIPEPKARLNLPRLVAELTAGLGEGTVGTLGLVDTWSPVERTRLLPYGNQAVHPAHPGHALIGSALEPSRLVRGVSMPHEALLGAKHSARHLARVEGLEWWTRPTHRIDLYAAWYDEALAWLELRHPDTVLLRGWID